MLAGDNEAVLNLRYTRTLPSKDVPGVQMRKEVLLHQEPTKKVSLNSGNDTVVADEGLAVVWVVITLESIR